MGGGGDEMVTTMHHRRLNKFDMENVTVATYLESLVLYFDDKNIAGDKKVPALLSNIGAKTYGLLRSLVAPKVPKDKTLDKIKKLKSHFEPTRSAIAECYRFNRRDQAAGETIADYVA